MGVFTPALYSLVKPNPGTFILWVRLVWVAVNAGWALPCGLNKRGLVHLTEMLPSHNEVNSRVDYFGCEPHPHLFNTSQSHWCWNAMLLRWANLMILVCVIMKVLSSTYITDPPCTEKENKSWWTLSNVCPLHWYDPIQLRISGMDWWIKWMNGRMEWNLDILFIFTIKSKYKCCCNVHFVFTIYHFLASSWISAMHVYCLYVYLHISGIPDSTGQCPFMGNKWVTTIDVQNRTHRKSV